MVNDNVALQKDEIKLDQHRSIIAKGVAIDVSKGGFLFGRTHLCQLMKGVGQQVHVEKGQLAVGLFTFQPYRP